MSNNEYIVVIPARGGSKRLPNKNIRLLNGLPLIAYSILYAKKSLPGIKIYVSTDSPEIARVALDYGAEIIARPENLSGDHVTTAKVLKHAVECIIEQGISFQYVILLQATNPLRPDYLILNAIKKLEESGRDSLIGVSSSDKKLGKIVNGKFVPWNYYYGQRSQDMELLYYENGLLYISKKELLLQEKIVEEETYPMIIDHIYGQVDIDTLEDFELASFFAKTRKIGILESLKDSFVVSCQAEGEDPFNTPEYVGLFARAAQMGGAKAIRSEGLKKIEYIKRNVDLPVIGLLKSKFDDGTVRITGSFCEVESLIDLGCDIIAIDGTFRLRDGLTGPEFISEVKKRYDCIVLADIARYEEGVAAQAAGADCVSTTLSGYTPETFEKNNGLADYELITKLSQSLNIPVFAEGRINTPKDAEQAMAVGAYAVISGSAITRPRVITSWFVNAIKK